MVPRIPNRKYLCYLLGITLEELKDLLEKVDFYYYCKEEIKKDKLGKPLLDKFGNPKVRVLFPSKGKLKKVQNVIRRKILDFIPLPSTIMGGVKGKDNIQNARFHQGNKFKFVVDLKDFFSSISDKIVLKALVRSGFYPPIAKILASLTTYTYRVPQGAPTSTAIANLVFLLTDKAIIDFCQHKNIKYSRFVDDLTFSSKIDFKEDTSTLIGIIEGANFKINQKKTFYTSGEAMITGILVGNNSLDVSDDFKNKMRDTDNYTLSQTLGRKRYYHRVKKAGPRLNR